MHDFLLNIYLIGLKYLIVYNLIDAKKKGKGKENLWANIQIN